MTNTQTNKLLQYVHASQRRFIPTSQPPSRRSARGKGTGTGQVLKGSRVVSEVGLERVFNHPSWK